jgi:hypothetical protein
MKLVIELRTDEMRSLATDSGRRADASNLILSVSVITMEHRAFRKST